MSALTTNLLLIVVGLGLAYASMRLGQFLGQRSLDSRPPNPRPEPKPRLTMHKGGQNLHPTTNRSPDAKPLGSIDE